MYDYIKLSEAKFYGRYGEEVNRSIFHSRRQLKFRFSPTTITKCAANASTTPISLKGAHTSRQNILNALLESDSGTLFSR